MHNKEFPNSTLMPYSALSKSYSQMLALSLSLGRHPLGAPQRQMWKSLRRDFSSQLFFFTNFLQCAFLFLYRTSSEFCGGDNICSSGKEKVYLHRKHRRSIRLYWKQLWQSQLEKEIVDFPTILKIFAAYTIWLVNDYVFVWSEKRPSNDYCFIQSTGLTQ